MNRKEALRLLKDLNQEIIMCGDEWAEIEEDEFLIILKNYINLEE